MGKTRYAFPAAGKQRQQLRALIRAVPFSSHFIFARKVCILLAPGKM
jgi:hypothetical protein